MKQLRIFSFIFKSYQKLSNLSQNICENYFGLKYDNHQYEDHLSQQETLSLKNFKQITLRLLQYILGLQVQLLHRFFEVYTGDRTISTCDLFCTLKKQRRMSTTEKQAFHELWQLYTEKHVTPSQWNISISLGERVTHCKSNNKLPLL